MKKVRLHITDLQLHARSFRSAKSFAKTIKPAKDGKGSLGRIYANGKPEVNTNGAFRFVIPLPEDLQQQVNNGEVELEIILPEGGASVFLSKDVKEKAEQLKQKQRRQQIHSGRHWRKE